LVFPGCLRASWGGASNCADPADLRAQANYAFLHLKA
jgi:hypothetical protein